MAYVCVELVNGACTVWAEQAPFIPPLTIAEGWKLGWGIVACYATAWSMGLLTRFLFIQMRS